MPQRNLRVIDPEFEHPRDRARREVKRFRLDREKEKLPISNQSTGATNLFVDEVIARTERTIMEAPRARYKVNPVLIAFLLFGSFIGLVWLFIAIS